MRVYVEAFGCAQNLGEATAIDRATTAAGHSVVRDPGLADVGVLVTCGVIGPTEARMVRRYRALVERVPHVIVTGCLVPMRTALLGGPGIDRTSFVPIREQARIPDLISRLGPATPPPLPAGPEAGPASATEEVVIAQGCTSACSYCFSRLARGHLMSVPPLDVLSRVAAARDRGAAEVRLSSLDTSCWGEDVPASGGLPSLLESVGELPGDFQVRLGMMSPQSLGPISGRVFQALRHPKFFRFLHLPVQSGDDRVLHEMRRGYSVEQFRQLVQEARDFLPDLMLSTDVIVGFPTEGEAEFEATLRLIDSVAPEVVNVTRFSPRPMTPAARLRPLPSSVVKRRSRALTELRMRVARRRLERWIGWEGDVRVVEAGRDGTSVARMPNYLPVVLPDRRAVGQRVHLRVDGARSTFLFGRPAATAGLRGPEAREASTVVG
ncbi:MAG TPA: tRNA (N(6)-L-threonylcarbamoyladenosine(37)-C(2))-methylthiotransferase [Thermoplasmata archaeon]|nr:tRNA (N(6)-L-threonylcarbamoyladenosine(37)-C(2))-methylthiotransferase [Thermoplasmata archaeon]